MTTANLTPEAAKARIETLKADGTFRSRLLSKEAAAVAEWNDLHRNASNNQTGNLPASEASKQAIVLLKDDPAFRRKLLDGNLEAKEQWNSLHRQAAEDV